VQTSWSQLGGAPPLPVDAALVATLELLATEALVLVALVATLELLLVEVALPPAPEVVTGSLVPPAPLPVLAVEAPLNVPVPSPDVGPVAVCGGVVGSSVSSVSPAPPRAQAARRRAANPRVRVGVMST